MIRVQKKLTDAQKDAIYDLLKHDCSIPYIAHEFGCAKTVVYNIWHAGKALESRNPTEIEEYKNGSHFVMANYNWAKAKFGAESMFDDEIEPEECGSATAIEVLINQQRDILIELARIRTLLEEG